MKKFRDTAGKVSPDMREMATCSFSDTESPMQYREAMEKQWWSFCMAQLLPNTGNRRGRVA